MRLPWYHQLSDNDKQLAQFVHHKALLIETYNYLMQNIKQSAF